MKLSASALALLYLLVVVALSWGYLAEKNQRFPAPQIDGLVSELTAYFTQSHHESIGDMLTKDHQELRSGFDFGGLRIADTGFRDEGFLLIARYSKSHSQAIVELFDLANAKVLHRWVPGLDAILGDLPAGSGNTAPGQFRSQHPLLLENGDLVILDGEGVLTRIDPCGRPRWVIHRHFHHSIEQDSDGNLVVPVVVANRTGPGGLELRDDGVAIVSPEGRILREFGLRRILIEAGYRGLVYGVGEYESDRFHLNDAQPLTGKTADSGVLLSIRNLSSVALYVPRTDKLKWLKTGPWLNQHDINEIRPGVYSIFGNDLVRGADVIVGDTHSEIYVYEAGSGRVSTPYSEALRRTGMASKTQGRARILDNGDAYIEETDRGRLLRVSRQGLRWEYVNRTKAKTVGALHWSRYIPAGDLPILSPEALACDMSS